MNLEGVEHRQPLPQVPLGKWELRFYADCCAVGGAHSDDGASSAMAAAGRVDLDAVVVLPDRTDRTAQHDVLSEVSRHLQAQLG